jgi:hypothetical protein
MNTRILDKIKACLARADESQNDNAHEREIAMRQANAMLAKHGLTLADITDEAEIKDNLGMLGRVQRELTTKFVWESGVWCSIARLNGCYVVRTPGRGKMKIWLIGRQLRCEVVKSVASWVVQSIIREAIKQGYPKASFGNGAWSGVSEQVDRILANMARGDLGSEQVSTGTALIIVDQHKKALIEAKSARDEFFPRLKKGTYRYSMGNGYGAGREYGSRIGLNQQVGGSSQKRIGA